MTRFTEGTRFLMKDGSTKPVERIKVGDQLMKENSSTCTIVGKRINWDIAYTFYYGDSSCTLSENALLILQDKQTHEFEYVRARDCKPHNYYWLKSGGVFFPEQEDIAFSYISALLATSVGDFERKQLTGSTQERLSTLAGFADSCCQYIPPDRFRIINTSFEKEIIFLARSLGLKTFPLEFEASRFIPCLNTVLPIGEDEEQTLNKLPFVKEEDVWRSYYSLQANEDCAVLLEDFSIVLI